MIESYIALAVKAKIEGNITIYVPEIIASAFKKEKISMDVNNWRQCLGKNHLYITDPQDGRVLVDVKKCLTPQKGKKYVSLWGGEISETDVIRIQKKYSMTVYDASIGDNSVDCVALFFEKEESDGQMQEYMPVRIYMDKPNNKYYLYIILSFSHFTLTKPLINRDDYSYYVRTDEEYKNWLKVYREQCLELDVKYEQPEWHLIELYQKVVCVS